MWVALLFEWTCHSGNLLIANVHFTAKYAPLPSFPRKRESSEGFDKKMDSRLRGNDELRI